MCIIAAAGNWCVAGKEIESQNSCRKSQRSVPACLCGVVVIDTGDKNPVPEPAEHCELRAACNEQLEGQQVEPSGWKDGFKILTLSCKGTATSSSRLTKETIDNTQLVSSLDRFRPSNVGQTPIQWPFSGPLDLELSLPSAAAGTPPWLC
jgi:hypothetical protein